MNEYQIKKNESNKSYKEMILVLVIALFDVVTDFFFTNAGDISPVAVPIVETVGSLLGSGGSSSGRSGVLEASSFSGSEEGKEDEQADKEGLHFSYDFYWDCVVFYFYFFQAQYRLYK